MANNKVRKSKFMKKLFTTLSFLALTLITFGQQRIDSSFEFQTDPEKKYSIYVPSEYDGSPNKLMLGLHPLNPGAWDAKAWCDTLIVFAEANQLLLICPDGGSDGAVDDPIDIAFTSVLLDSMEAWYSVDTAKVYAMGFSWGARTTYTYGLNNISRLKGFIPIGAAITGTSQVSNIIQNSTGKPFYLVHGNNDNPNSRFFPILQALEDNEAIVNSLLMTGVGHTINFPNRNQILNTAFHWVDSVHCASLQTTALIDPAFANASFTINPNPLQIGQDILLAIKDLPKSNSYDFTLLDQHGKKIQRWTRDLQEGNSSLNLSLKHANLNPGVYYLQVEMAEGFIWSRSLVLFN